MDDNGLIKIANQARSKAYAPYSGFRVGAALLCEDGTIFSGANVENAVYGLSLCAERVTISKAVSNGYRSFKALAIIAEGEAPCPPCGACRQFLSEFGAEIDVIMANSNGDFKKAKIKELLPFAFNSERLSSKQG